MKKIIIALFLIGFVDGHCTGSELFLKKLLDNSYLFPICAFVGGCCMGGYATKKFIEYRYEELQEKRNKLRDSKNLKRESTEINRNQSSQAFAAYRNIFSGCDVAFSSPGIITDNGIDERSQLLKRSFGTLGLQQISHKSYVDEETQKTYYFFTKTKI